MYWPGGCRTPSTRLQAPGEGDARELAALVGGEDFRRAMAGQRGVEGVDAKAPHSALGGCTPAEAYRGARPVDMMDTSLRAVPTAPPAAAHRHGNPGPRNQAA